MVTGLVAKVGGRRLFVPISRVAELSEDRIALAKAKVDLRSFERRDGEVLLREDILRHRLIDVADAELVRAWDIELRATDDGWIVSCLDTRRPARLFGLIRPSSGHPCQDWKAFEPLIGHTPSVRSRSSFGKVRRLKPAQIADLLEDASRTRRARRSSTWCTPTRSWRRTCSRSSTPTSPTGSSGTRPTPRWPTSSPTCEPTTPPTPWPSSPRTAARRSWTSSRWARGPRS